MEITTDIAEVFTDNRNIKFTTNIFSKMNDPPEILKKKSLKLIENFIYNNEECKKLLKNNDI